MKNYEVRLPIAGYVSVHVAAEDEDSAIEKALDTDITTDDIEEWSTYKMIVEGNVFHGIQNEYEIDEL